MFGRDGDDLTLTVPISYAEAVFGTDLRVPTMDGSVTVRVAAGTPSGRTLRVRGRGVPRRDGSSGDLLVTLEVDVPTALSPEARKALEEFALHAPAPNRGTIDETVRRHEFRGSHASPTRRWARGDADFYFAEITSDDAKVLIISVAARMAGMHPQTLRQYDRLGLVQPGRATGGGRRYSVRDVALLREVQRLTQDDGRQPRRHQADHRARAGHVRAAAAARRGEERDRRAGRGSPQLEALSYPRRDLVPTRPRPHRSRRLEAPLSPLVRAPHDRLGLRCPFDAAFLPIAPRSWAGSGYVRRETCPYRGETGMGMVDKAQGNGRTRP